MMTYAVHTVASVQPSFIAQHWNCNSPKLSRC